MMEIDNQSLTNRPDLWGHYGIAREIAAITDHKLLALDVVEVDNPSFINLFFYIINNKLIYKN